MSAPMKTAQPPIAAPGSGQNAQASLDAAVYLGLSFASGFIELGSIIYAAKLALPTAVIITFGLIYQVGALFQNPLAFTPRQYRAMVVLATSAAIATLWHGQLIWFALLLASGGLQGLREEAVRRCSVGTLPKRIARIGGFAMAGIFNVGMLVATMVVIMIMSEVLRRRPTAVGASRPPAQFRFPGLLGVTMIVHQMHYFTYAYTLPILFIQFHGLNFALVGAAFALGWISYSLTPSALRGLPTFRVVLIGHVFVSLILVVMAFTFDSLPLLLGGWFASGFGGGTVFGIRRLASEWKNPSTTHDFDTCENIGHVLGVALAIALIFFVPELSVLLLAAAGLAAVVAILITWGQYHRPTNV